MALDALETQARTANPVGLDKKTLSDLQKLASALQDDLRKRSDDVGEIRMRLESAWEEARSAERTRATYETWREESLTQVAVAWVLACVFVRDLEDNHLVDDVRLAGSGDALARAVEAHDAFFRQHPTVTDREYLQDVFEQTARLPGLRDLLGKDHNPLWEVGLSGDGAKRLIEFWRERDPETGLLLRTFERAPGDTRFLGDLYQDLSESARKRYALLQTPEFVEEFILDRTLDPAIQEFGLDEVRLIDPTCGSGHFLLGAFHRLLGKWQQREPGTPARDLVRRALDAVYGVDLNPFAVAIARFRLLVAALQACCTRGSAGAGPCRLKDAPNFHLHLAAGDSLLHGQRFERTGQGMFPGKDWLPDAVARGDYDEATQILGQQYHAVVGNPPYITDKDEAHREEVRKRYASCHGKFSLGVPFTERFFELALEGREAGCVGLITTNSFMKREFGKKVIEECFPRVDLTHVLDTSGAYIPGHGTPTVILFGRNRPPARSVVRAALGIRGEPETPDVPADGKVWQSVVRLLDTPGAQNEFVSIADVPRETLSKHPWSMGGGGAGELKEAIEAAGHRRLGQLAEHIGISSVTGEDDLYILTDSFTTTRLALTNTMPVVLGDSLRDWSLRETFPAVWPFDADFEVRPLAATPREARFLWPYRTSISQRKRFGVPMLQRGLTWYEWQELYSAKLRTPLSIAFAEVATHNHFVLDRGGKVFKQTAPVIKLPPDATEDDHLALLGLLNSSVACFWMRQVCYPKGGDKVGTEGARRSKNAWEDRIARSAGSIEPFPVPGARSHVLPLVSRLDLLARHCLLHDPGNIGDSVPPTLQHLQSAGAKSLRAATQMIALQEELDWLCYRLYSLLDEPTTPLHDLDSLPGIELGQRAFEIVMARKMRDGELQTTWFERHGSTPITEVPVDWPESYRVVVQRRIELIESHPYIRLIEQPEYKRRWQREPWDEQVTRALKSWLLDRLESPAYWPVHPDGARAAESPALTTCARLADAARRDADFTQVAALYRGRDDFDVTALVTELVTAEAVPYLPILRYTDSGLRKRAQWEATWASQRREDAGEDVGKIPVPPKYDSKDFQKSDCWRLRGKLDVPKERFVSYPGAERDTDPTPVVAWAGYDALQQATALAAYYIACRENEGWSPERLQPLLAGLDERVPWLLQWHNDIDPATGERLGTFYDGFVEQERRALGFTREALRNWRPPAAPRRQRKRKGEE